MKETEIKEWDVAITGLKVRMYQGDDALASKDLPRACDQLCNSIPI